MRVIDQIFAALEDGKCHDIIELVDKVELSEVKLGIVLAFLAEYGFIEIDEKGLKVKPAPECQRFLKRIESIS